MANPKFSLGNINIGNIGSTINNGLDKLNNLTNKAESLINTANSVADRLANTRRYINNVIDDPKAYVMNQLEALSTGTMPTDIGIDGSGISDILKSINNVKRSATKIETLWNKVQDIVDDRGVVHAMNVSRRANPRGRLDGLVSSAMDTIGAFLNDAAGSGIFANNASGTASLMSSDYIRDQYNKDPISSTFDLSNHIKVLLEDQGYIASKYRAIQYSRDYYFVGNPVLESDISSPYYRSYVVWTRPDLNTITFEDGNYLPSSELLFYPELLQLTATDMPLYSELCMSTCNKTAIWPLLSNYTKEITPPKLGEYDREGVKNMHGVQSQIPGIPEYHNIDISVTFNDNSRGDIAKLFQYIEQYKHFTSAEGYPMGAKYIRYNSYNYYLSCYIITVDINWEIIGFGVALQMTVKEAPTHFTQHKKDGFTKEELLEEFTVTFNAQTYKPLRPAYFDQLNRLTGFNRSNLVDTKGSGVTLQYFSRADEMPANSPNLSGSVFQASPYLWDKGTKMTETLDPLSLLEQSSFDVAQQTQVTAGMGNASIRMQGLMPYQGVFEMLAKKPGVYVEYTDDEPNRPRFKLGFSY